MAMRQLKPLTSLRAFFALWVLCRHWFHTYVTEGAVFDVAFGGTFSSHGYLGVDGFFVLSGFILMYNYCPPEGGRLDMRRFIVARIARIYPAHVACLILFAVAVVARDYLIHKNVLGVGLFTAGNFVLELFLLSAWRYSGATGWNDVSWSVSAEWFAYVFFPVFMLAAPRYKTSRILAVAAVALAALGIVEATSGEHLSLSGGLCRLVPEFLLGVLLCRLREARRDYAGWAFGGIASLALCGVAIAINVDTLFVAGAGCLIFSLSYEKDLLTRPLSVSWLTFMGEVSYCIYIVQRIPEYLFLFARGRFAAIAQMPVAGQVTLLLGITLLAALLLHFTVEKPMRAFIQARTRRRTKPADSLATIS